MMVFRPNQNRTLQGWIPNPYPLPGTPYSISFESTQHRAPALNRVESLNCINVAYRQINGHIRAHGNEVIPRTRPGLEYRYGTVEFSISSGREVRPGAEMSYSTAAAVLGAYALKMSQEGYRPRLARVFVTDGGKPVGDALFGLAEYDGTVKGNMTAKMPNPFAVVGTPFSLRFREQWGAERPLDETHVVACILSVRRAVMDRLRTQGNDRVPSVLAYHFNGVGFTLESARRQVLFDHVVPVVLSFGTKMAWDGYRGRYADIIWSDGRGGVGHAFMA
ncbi:MAG: hypothetical protein Q9208_007982 [Pyrenodesmia sp. 3 TL-2023]